MDLLTTHRELNSTAAKKPRVGFVGVGWIGKNRMEAIANSNFVRISAVADSSPDILLELGPIAPHAHCVKNMEQLLCYDLQAVVIATPSALHAHQSIEALKNGVAVFCQKPLGRNAKETQDIVEAAKQSNVLLGVDFSYRYVHAVQEIYKRAKNGCIGDIYAVRLVFHNAYGPDKEWFYNKELSGGGCVIDLGVHLVDMALWMLNSPGIKNCCSRLYSKGVPFDADKDAVEDYATAQLLTDTDVTIDVACSWNLPAGRDAVIEADIIGTKGALALKNVDGSFYDFCAYEYRGAKEEVIFNGSDNWGGRAAVSWAKQLAENPGYDPSIESVVQVAQTIDMIYGR